MPSQSICGCEFNGMSSVQHTTYKIVVALCYFGVLAMVLSISWVCYCCCCWVSIFITKSSIRIVFNSFLSLIPLLCHLFEAIYRWRTLSWGICGCIMSMNGLDGCDGAKEFQQAWEKMSKSTKKSHTIAFIQFVTNANVVVMMIYRACTYYISIVNVYLCGATFTSMDGSFESQYLCIKMMLISAQNRFSS